MSHGLRPEPPGSRRWDVIGVGDIDVDMFLEVPTLAGRDEKVPARLLGEHPGGMIANVTCAVSVLGGSAAMVGRVGTDAYGEIAVRGLRDLGVDTSQVTVVNGGRTFYCVIMLDGSGEKALTAVLTDCHRPGRGDIDPACFADTRVVHLAGDYLDLAIWVGREARDRGALVSLDLEASTAAHGVPALRPLLGDTDVLFMNHAGSRMFHDDPERALHLAHALGPRVVVVTLGAHGVLASDSVDVVRVEVLQSPVVDTTGAGDCFIGAFLSQLLTAPGVEQASRYAVAAATASIRAVGARTALPDHEAVLELFDRTRATHVRQGDT